MGTTEVDKCSTCEYNEVIAGIPIKCEYYDKCMFSHKLESFYKKTEPFKAGDWVTQPTSNIPFRFTEDVCHLGLCLWKPEEGEWCVFYDVLEDDNFAIQKFSNTNKYSNSYRYSSTCSSWEHIAPLEFIQTLKD